MIDSGRRDHQRGHQKASRRKAEPHDHSLSGHGRRQSSRVATCAAFGFIYVVQARNQLFVENTREPAIPFLERRDRKTLKRWFRLWGIVLAGDLTGGVALVVMLR